MGPVRKPLSLALLLSLLGHLLLLSLILGGQGLGQPGLRWPGRDRQIEAIEPRVVTVSPRVPAAAPPAPLPAVFGVPPQPPTTAATVAPARTRAEAMPHVKDTTPAADATAPLRDPGPVVVAPAPTPLPAVIALERNDPPVWVVPPPSVPMPAVAAAPSASSPQTAPRSPRQEGDETQAQVDLKARERELEVARLDRSALDAQRQAEQLQAARVEALRIEAARQEAARQEAARLAAARQEAARVEAVRSQAQSQEAALEAAARHDAALQEAARRDAVRAQTARLETERQDAAGQAAARQDAARASTAQADAARREALLRAIGRQLDEEAAQREAASNSARLPGTQLPSFSSARRGRLFGRTDANTELVLYAEALARKIQLNMTFDMVREAAKRPHTDPIVTLAIRRDGSVESVTFVVSSGVAEIDEAVRRIVQSQTPYLAFTPALARDFDVIEIRRTWRFDMAVRLH